MLAITDCSTISIHPHHVVDVWCQRAVGPLDPCLVPCACDGFCSGAWYSGEALGDEDGVGEDNHGLSGRYFWYGDHDLDTNQAANSDFAIDRKGALFFPTLPRIQGGLYACSTTDFVTWRNEGIMVSTGAGDVLYCSC